MISLHIEAANETEFAQQLTAVAALLNAQLNTVAQPAPARGKKSQPSEPGGAGTAAQTSTGTETPNTGSEKAADPTGGAGAAASAGSSAATGAQSVDRAEVAKKCTLYGQPTKGGPALLKELFVKYGSANGKWSEITDDKLPALNVELDELLA